MRGAGAIFLLFVGLILTVGAFQHDTYDPVTGAVHWSTAGRPDVVLLVVGILALGVGLYLLVTRPRTVQGPQ